MGGPKSNLNTQDQIAQQQLQMAQTSQGESEQDRARRIALQQPAIDRLTKESSGSKGDLYSAAAPLIAQITDAASKNKGAIMESQGPGVARDVALTQSDAATRGGIAGTINSEYTGSFDKLANIGAGIGSFSLSEAGAALSGFGGAASTNQSVINAKEQEKSSTMSFLGSLAGAGGSALSGRFMK